MGVQSSSKHILLVVRGEQDERVALLARRSGDLVDLVVVGAAEVDGQLDFDWEGEDGVVADGEAELPVAVLPKCIQLLLLRQYERVRAATGNALDLLLAEVLDVPWEEDVPGVGSGDHALGRATVQALHRSEADLA